jgi:LacI family transcriptional regulator
MKHGAQPTLTDVARAAGVGLATASRVINGGENVSAATLKRVQAAVRQLGYEPNHAARMLKGGRTKMIGLLVPSIADSFFSSCAEAAEEVARRHDSLLIFAVSNNNPGVELEKLSVLMRHRPDGLLVVPSDPRGRRFLSFVRQSSVPIVTFDRPVAGQLGVLTNNYEAAREATTHLLEHGYRRILCYGGDPHLYTIKERLRGYCDAMRQAGLPTHIDTSYVEEAGEENTSLATCLRSSTPPEALFTLKNSTTIASFQVLQQLRIAVPARVAMLGFDDFVLADKLRPSISVVQQPIEDVGRRSAELLFEQLQRTGLGPLAAKRLAAKQVVLKCRMVLRSSCGCKSK